MIELRFTKNPRRTRVQSALSQHFQTRASMSAFGGIPFGSISSALEALPWVAPLATALGQLRASATATPWGRVFSAAPGPATPGPQASSGYSSGPVAGAAGDGGAAEPSTGPATALSRRLRPVVAGDLRTRLMASVSAAGASTPSLAHPRLNLSGAAGPHRTGEGVRKAKPSRWGGEGGEGGDVGPCGRVAPPPLK